MFTYLSKTLIESGFVFFFNRVCETLIRLCGPKPEYYWQYLWKLFEIILKSQRIKLAPDSISVLLR
jgi:hypothetical protein